MQSRYFFDISRNIYQKKVSTLQYLLLFTIHSSTYFCFWFIKFIKFQSCNFLLTFFKLKPVFHRHKVFWCILILFYSCLLNAYYSCLLLHLMLIHAYYIYIYIYIYIYMYIYKRSACRQLLFCSLRAHQYSSDQMTILKDQSARTTARVVSIAYRLWICFLINRVFNITKLTSVI